MHRVDFAVVGAGPAGSSAARRLAMAGARVLLLERRPMPRPKPCGGALSAHGLASLGFDLPPSLIDAPVFGMKVHLAGAVSQSRFDRPVAVLVTRSRFDHFLVTKAQEAGASVRWEDVRAVEAGDRGVTIRTAGGDYFAACAVLCDGAVGRLSRLVRPPDRPDEHLFSLSADIPVGPTDPYSDLRDVLGIYHGVVKWGYGWVFHHGNYYSVGVGGLHALMPRPREVFERFLVERGLSIEAAAVRGHFIPCGGVRRPRCADRLLVAGDAAGLADPFQGEGLAHAIRSGQMAAEAALEAAGRGDLSRRGLAAYEDRCRRVFDAEFRRARALARLMQWWPSPLIHAVASDPAVLHQWLEIPQGRQTYRRFVRWLLPYATWRWVRSGFPAAGATSD